MTDASENATRNRQTLTAPRQAIRKSLAWTSRAVRWLGVVNTMRTAHVFGFFFFLYCLTPGLLCYDLFRNGDTMTRPPDSWTYIQIAVKTIPYLIITALLLHYMTYRAEHLSSARRIAAFMIVSVSTLTSCVAGFAGYYRSWGIIETDGTVTHDPSTALYFSIVTWTTLGYGDLQPTNDVRSFAATEALLGYVFMAVFIGFLLVLAGRKT